MNPAAAPKVTYDNYVITCTPNTATVTHRNVVTTNVGGREQTYSRSVHVFEKRGGRWVVVGNAGHTLDDATALLYMESHFSTAIRHHDTAWVERAFAADATDAIDGVIRNKAQAIAAMKADKPKTANSSTIAIDSPTHGSSVTAAG